MSKVTGFGRIAHTLGHLRAPAPLRYAGRAFKSWFSGAFTSGFKSLSSRNVQAAQKAKPSLLRKQEVETIKNAVQTFVDYVKADPLPKESFKDGVRRVLGQLDFTEREKEIFLERAIGIKFKEPGLIILQVMAEPYVKAKLDEIVSHIEDQFPEGVSDGKFKKLVPDALKAKGQTGEALKAFVKKAAWVVTEMEKGRPLKVLRIMHNESKRLW